MSILSIFVGIIIGLGVKFGLDEYHYFKQEQEKTKNEMEEVLTKFKAIELNK